MDGILLIDKPRGPTSHDMVDRVRRLSANKKVGHTGTLDPAACGLLVMCIGRMTRASRLFTELEKEYTGTILYGRQTDTLDLEGSTVRRSAVPETVVDDSAAWVRSHMGIHIQKAPRYSARKWKGKPLHRYAREGRETPVSEKVVNISEVEISPGQTRRRSDFRIVASSGFFVRSWVRDLGCGINVPTTLGYLRRERVGPFRLEQAVSIESLTGDNLAYHLISGEEALPWIPSLAVEEHEKKRLQQGGFVTFSGQDDFRSGEVVKIVSDGRVLLFARVNGETVRPWIVLHPGESN